ncbi:hypothetical protein L1987_25423 [Smallanthus sonchifolius]|uniref:Uncharacterized protein n=1 Tax=Smallanthus sonchifolius TaxID=185202 RepID=A0ACB9INC6_9ASTR|nr:hypothetical protein L1987_25423 [Smallanthus sonchifolius]
MITKDPHRALTSWNNSLHFCDWRGVKCGKRHRRVTYIALGRLGLEGSLSPHVGNLSFLRWLSLTNNSFQGAIPHEIGRLSRLRWLTLGLNRFDGVIPTNLSGCSNLEMIDLSTNKLVGSIPNEIGFLFKLKVLSVQDNKLTGGIPPFLGNITSMELLAVKENPLGGSIPNTIGHWKNLNELYCGACNLSGTIPNSFYNLSLLAYFSMFDNQLTGSLPPTMGAMLPHLVLLELWGNQLTGPLPPSISNCSSLTDLERARNKFSGKLTIDFSKLREISFISLYSNFFGSKEGDEMKFIDSLQNCTRLETLDLSYCKFQGVLPTSIGNLSNNLYELYLYANQLHGSLPRSIGNLLGLNRLHLDRNQFTGNIPSTIGNLRKLKAFYLYQNQLSGHIPDAIGNLSSLITLSLFSNKLERVIPSSLGNCHSLLELYLNDNKITGKIPIELLQLPSLSIKLDLSQNNMFGSLPIGVGALKMLSELDLSENNLSGEIPSSLSGCASLSSLSLKGNLFQVPTSGVFANETTFSVLGNSRLCGGFVKLGLPKCKEKKKHKTKLPLFVIVILIASTIFTIICLAYAWFKKKSKNQSSQSSMSKRFFKVTYNQLHKATNGFSEANLIGNDFGLARFLGTSYQNSSSGIKGTIGYAPPVWPRGNEMATSGDIYSFGILLLEAITGKMPTDNIFNEGLSLHKFASMALPDHIIDVIDVNILNVYQEELFMQNKERNVKKIEECLASTIKIGVSCSVDSPPQRMDIKKLKSFCNWDGFFTRCHNGNCVDFLFDLYSLATLVDPKKGFLEGLGPLLTVLVVGANIMAGGPLSGASMNPSRSFGPAGSDCICKLVCI